MTENHATWAISPDVRATYSEDGAVLLDINKGMCYSLNSVGARIWLTIESSPSEITLDGIVGALAVLYGIPYRQLETDTKECLDKLLQSGLIRRNGSIGPLAGPGRGE
jgi:Coenzyme PQQ synthesis protein D (PqqD)